MSMFAKPTEDSITDGLTHRLDDPRKQEKSVPRRALPIALDDWMAPKLGEETVRDASRSRSISPRPITDGTAQEMDSNRQPKSKRKKGKKNKKKKLNVENIQEENF